MRGKVDPEFAESVTLRITPAYAGKSIVQLLIWCYVWGSPPPMRGKVFNTMTDYSMHGITPAYAGKRKQMCNFFGIP